MTSAKRIASRTSWPSLLTRASILATLLLAFGLVFGTTVLAAPDVPDQAGRVAAIGRGSRLPDPALPNAPMGKSTIGDYVWHDFNANGDHVGDASEAEFTAGINDVVLELWRWDKTLPVPAWVLDATTTTGDDTSTPAVTETGWYNFPATGDVTGVDYWVKVAASNFDPPSPSKPLGGPLYGYVLTSATNYIEPIPTQTSNPFTWLDADFGYAKTSVSVTKSPPEQTLLPGSTATFQLAIKNTGEVPLEDIAITEHLAGATCTPNPIPGPVAPGATVNATCKLLNVQAPATNTVTVTGTPTDGNGTPLPGTQPTADSNPVKVLIADPRIQVIKEVSVNGGSTWFDANATTGPYVGSAINPKFRFTITNLGNVPLNTITLNDNVYGSLTAACGLTGVTLAAAPGPGNTHSCTITEPWAVGQHTDTATTTGQYTDDSGVTATPSDTDDANYFGADPKIKVVKTAGNAADGSPFVIAPPLPVNVVYTYVLTNIGNVALFVDKTGADPTYKLTDDSCSPVSYVSGDTGNDNLLGTSETWTFTCTASINKDTVNTATVPGRPEDPTNPGNPPPGTTPPTGTDKAEVKVAQIQVVKEVSVDGGSTWYDANSPTGPYVGSANKPRFRFTITNTGSVTLNNITLTDSVYDLSACSLPASLAPSATYACTVVESWAAGQHTNTATTTGTYSDPTGVLQVNDTDDANYFGADPKIQVVKTAGNAPDGSPLIVNPPLPVNVTYTYVVTNPGNLALFLDKTGVDPTYHLTDDKCSPVTYVSGDANNNNLLDTSESWTFNCIASISQSTINTATVTGRPEDPTNPGNPPPGTTPPSDTDTAEVQVQTGAIGDLVWWDVNGNGVQDAGEPGIPGVTVILPGSPNDTTDSNGIYTFTNVAPGSHTVTIPSSMFGPGGPLAGFTTSPTGQGTPATDSNGLVTANGVEASLTLPANTNDLSIDFGFVKPTSYRVEKTRVTQSPTTPTSEVHFQITVYNTGSTWITTLPLVDTYDMIYLTYGYNSNFAAPVSNDNVDDGTINWSNVAPAGGLAPSGSVTVDVWFTAKTETLHVLPNDVTINYATVPQQGTKVDADGPTGPIPPADSPYPPQTAEAPVQIINPTGVILARAGASATASGVLVTWETADERTLLGFNVLRGSSPDNLQLVTSELMLAQHAGASGGGTYSYLDAAGAGTYVYALELIGVDGTVRRVNLGALTVR